MIAWVRAIHAGGRPATVGYNWATQVAHIDRV